MSDSTIFINPASATADSNLLGLAVGGNVKFAVDAEGDVYGNNLILEGNTTTGTTTVTGDLTVEGSTTLGDSTTDTLTFNARVAQDVDFIPIGTTGTNDLGASSLPWDNLYVADIRSDASSADALQLIADQGGIDISTGSDSHSIDILGGNTITLKSVNGGISLSAGSPSYASGITLDTTGNVGIGTASPAQLLEVQGAAQTDVSLRIGDSVDYWDLRVMGSDNAENLKFYFNGSDQFIFDLDGVLRFAGSPGTGTRSTPAVFGNSEDLYLNARTNMGAGNIVFRTYDGVSTAATRMFIAQGGNVGIGTSTPSDKLDIADANLGYNFLFGSGGMTLSGAGTSNFSLAAGGSISLSGGTGQTTASGVTIDTNGDLTVGDDDLFVDVSAGNVGIGTATPTSLLQLVNPTASDTSNLFTVTRGTKELLSLSASAESGGRFETVLALGAGSDSYFHSLAFGGQELQRITVSNDQQRVGMNFISLARTANVNNFVFSGVGSIPWNQISGTQAWVLLDGSVSGASQIEPSAGSGNFRMLETKYTINASGAQTGTVTGIFLNATETTLNGFTHNLLDLQVGGTNKFIITNSGDVGIGDDSPDDLLDIEDANLGYNFLFGSGGITFSTAASDTIVMASDGNITLSSGTGASAGTGIILDTSGDTTFYGKIIGDPDNSVQLQAGGTTAGSSGNSSIFFLDSSGNTKGRYDTTDADFYGDSSDGDITISSSINCTTTDISADDGDSTADCLATDLTAAASATDTITVTDSGSFTVGDDVIVIQMDGVGAGNYDLMEISSTSISTAMTFTEELSKAYQATNAQVVRIPQYNDVTITSTGTLTASAWDGTTGGVLFIRADGTFDVNASGVVEGNSLGGAGGSFASGGSGGSTANCSGGSDVNGSDGTAGTAGNDGTGPGSGGGGGSPTAGSAGTTNGTSSGGGGGAGSGGGGSGGSHTSAASSPIAGADGGANSGGGGAAGSAGSAGSTGIAQGDSVFSILSMGSGGGSGSNGAGGGSGSCASSGGGDSSTGGQGGGGGNSGAGGAGGGIIAISAATLTNSGTIRANGANGSSGASGGTGFAGTRSGTAHGTGGGGGGSGAGGGGGAGGSIWLISNSLTAGTHTVSSGTGETSGSTGGNGGACASAAGTTGGGGGGGRNGTGASSGCTNAGSNAEDYYNGTGTAGTAGRILTTTSTNTYGTLFAGAVNTTAADLAEYYVAGNSNVEAGDVVIVGPNPEITLVNTTGNPQSTITQGVLFRAVKAYDQRLLGVISTDPGLVLGSIDGITGSPDKRALALAGRVPVKVSSSSLPIKIGDPLTSSTDSGKATKATQAGQIIGTALESWNPNSGQTHIMVFVNVSWYDPQIYLTDLQDFSIRQDQNNIFSILDDRLDTAINRLAVFSQSLIANLRAGLVETQSLIANTAIIDNLRSTQLTSPLIETELLKAQTVGVTGQLTAGSLVSPVVDAHKLRADQIQANLISAKNKDLIIDLSTSDNSATSSSSPFGTLAVKGNLDVSGDATVTGTLTAQRSTIDDLKTSTISARLAKLDQISSESIATNQLTTNLLEVSGTISASDYQGLTADQISGLDDKLTSLLKSTIGSSDQTPESTPSSGFTQQLAFDSATPEDQESTSLGIYESTQQEASFSALLAENVTSFDTSDGDYLSVNNGFINADAGFFSEYLGVMGQATITELHVSNLGLFGDNLAIGQNSISVLSNDSLYLQPSGRGRISLLANLMTLDDSGNVTVNGNLSVTGKLATDFLEAKEASISGSLTLRPSQFGEIINSPFSILNSAGDLVASIDATGSAEFKDVLAGVASFDKLLIATGVATPSSGLLGTTITTNATTGEGVMKTSTTEFKVISPHITPDSLVYITPTSPTKNQILYVKAKKGPVTPRPTLINPNPATQPGYFIVAIDQLVNIDIKFNWWIIN